MKFKHLLVSKKLLDKLFFIDIEEGSIRWRKSGTGTRRMNQEAGSTRNGYRVIQIDGVDHYAHILIWLYATGKYPEDEIDHIDRNRSNNKIINLREVTHQEQQFNVKVRKGKKEPTGVTYYPWKKKPYTAQIMINGKQLNLGRYRTIEEASNAYLKAKKQHHTIGVTK